MRSWQPRQLESLPGRRQSRAPPVAGPAAQRSIVHCHIQGRPMAVSAGLARDQGEWTGSKGGEGGSPRVLRIARAAIISTTLSIRHWASTLAEGTVYGLQLPAQSRWRESGSETRRPFCKGAEHVRVIAIDCFTLRWSLETARCRSAVAPLKFIPLQTDSRLVVVAMPSASVLTRSRSNDWPPQSAVAALFVAFPHGQLDSTPV